MPRHSQVMLRHDALWILIRMLPMLRHALLLSPKSAHLTPNCSFFDLFTQHHLKNKNTRKSAQNSDKQCKNTKYKRVKYMHH